METDPVFTGPKPTLIKCGSAEDQYIKAAEYLKESAEELRMPVWNGAVLAPSNKLAEETAEYLTKLGINAKAVKGIQW